MKNILLTITERMVLLSFAITFSLTLIWGISSGSETPPAQGQEDDKGGTPWVLNIEEETKTSTHYRNTRWTGEYLQMVFMSLEPGDFIDIEVHDDHDQFIRIEQGQARVLMGKSEDNLDFDETVSADWAIFIPAGYWHEVRNTGNTALKLYTIYAPGEHPEGTINPTYQDASEHDH